MANNKFKAAVKKAKGLYRSGRYKTFADAVKAAYKKKTKVKLIKPPAHPYSAKKKNKRTPKGLYKILSESKNGYVIKDKYGDIIRLDRKRFQGKKYKKMRVKSAKRIGSVKNNLEASLGRAMVEHFKTQSYSRTKQLDKTIRGLKKKLRSL